MDRDPPEDLRPHPMPLELRTVMTRLVQSGPSPLDRMADVAFSAHVIHTTKEAC